MKQQVLTAEVLLFLEIRQPAFLHALLPYVLLCLFKPLRQIRILEDLPEHFLPLFAARHFLKLLPILFQFRSFCSNWQISYRYLSRINR